MWLPAWTSRSPLDEMALLSNLSYLGSYGYFGHLVIKTEFINTNSVYHIWVPKLVPVNSVSVYSDSVPVNLVSVFGFRFLCTSLVLPP
jgi:hypothetical protein